MAGQEGGRLAGPPLSLFLLTSPHAILFLLTPARQTGGSLRRAADNMTLYNFCVNTWHCR